MRLRGNMAILAMAAALGAAQAQLPLNPESAAQIGALNKLGGKSTIDVITLRQGMLGVPLRFPGVVAGSETVQLGGQTLIRGVDYQIDAAAGVVYLMREIRSGDVLRVGYRYDESKFESLKAKSQFAGLAPFKFDIAAGALSMIMGFGITERSADGAITQSNVYGVNNRLSFGSASLKGLMLMGNRAKVDQESDYEFRGESEAKDTGKSHMMLQTLAMGLGGGGSIEVNYQDVSKNFSGFGSAESAGFSAQQVAQLQKEKGLKRFSLGMNSLNLGATKLSGSMKSIQDGGEDIEWKSLGLKSNGLELNWKSQRVGDAFSRFNDLAEGDREQLKKEAGMSRETLSGSFAQRAGKLNFSMNQVSDPESAKIERRELGFESKGYKFWYGDQEVDQDFRRMQSLRGDEQGLYGRELGMKRQWFGLQASLFGVGQPIKFSQSTLESRAGEYGTLDASLQGKGWSLMHSERNASDGFASFGAMQDGERNENINSIGRMYDPNGIGFRGEEVHWFNQSGGIGRSLTRVQGEPFKNWKASFDHLELTGAHDRSTVDTFRLDGGRFKIDFRNQKLGDEFGELTRLLELERNRLGIISGLERTDFSFDVKLSPSRSFLYSSMKANSPLGDAGREKISYVDPRLSIHVNQREVDPGFVNVNQLVDPEKDFLASLRGFKERDVKASWLITPNLKFDMFLLDSGSESLDQTRYIHNYELNWRPDKSTSILAKRLEERSDDPLTTLFANATDFFALTRDFGRYGKFSYLTESKDYDGLNSNLPDSEKRYFGYETKLNARTSLKAEETQTTFDDGGKENVSTKTVSTELSKHAGVSISDIRIDREGGDRDEVKRGYGFWMDIAKGLRLAYGFAQHQAGEVALDTQNQNLSITGGQVGNVQVGNTSFVANQWEDKRTQASGNLSLATVRPMQFFWLTNLKLAASMDTASDRAVWLKENKLFSLSGMVGSNGFGFDYRSQVGANGMRGIDRSAYFTTDQAQKNPLRFTLKYKQRNLPTGEEILIRDYALTARPFKNVELTHNLLTNPEVMRGDVILGSITQARRENRWKLDFNSGPNLQFGGEWREFSDQNQPLTRLGGVNLVFNKAVGSPLSMFYGVEESDIGGSRKRTDRYHLRFDQKPGPNKQISFFIGNVSYLRGMDTGQNRNNLTVQLDFQMKF